MSHAELGTRPEIKPGLRTKYEDQGWNWNKLSLGELTPQLQQTAGHLEGWFRQKKWLLESVYCRESLPGWTDLAFVYSPHGAAKIVRLAQHLNPSEKTGLRALIKLPENEVREDGMLKWLPTVDPDTLSMREGMIHPKSLGPFIGYHGVWLREQFIEKIDLRKAAFLSNLPNPDVVSWVNCHPLTMVRVKKSYYPTETKREIREHGTKFAFEVHLADAKAMIEEEIAKRQKKPMADQGLGLRLLQGVLDRFHESPDLLIRAGA
ncbi:MAG: hypothetical protein Q7K55_04070 [Candidatus Levybacteria bacterium]|nr:hypothetical protein [Candidatus Levybacteria bacterium]